MNICIYNVYNNIYKNVYNKIICFSIFSELCSTYISGTRMGKVTTSTCSCKCAASI